MLARLHREFNVSVAEVDHNDVWQSALIACTLVSNNPNHTRRSLQHIANWIETHWPDVSLVDDKIEMI